MAIGEIERGGPSTADLSRRDFLRAGGLGGLAAGLAAGADSAGGSARARSVILLLMVGGPSQLETFDPKPDAASDVRGPFGSIGTSVPGVRLCEHLPEIAARMNRLSLIRTLHHDEAPIHETGLQLLQTGRLSRCDQSYPHFGAVASRYGPRSGGRGSFVVLPEPIGPTGVAVPQGQVGGVLGAEHDPVFASGDFPDRLRPALDLSRERPATAASYGPSPFGRDCLRARRLVEAGTKVVVVNMATTVFDRVSWDAHGSRPFSNFADYKRELLPRFDRGFSALADDLRARGLWDSTLVVATGEFGRTPRINAQGGRDHWPGAWSALLAGGGTPEGLVIGSTDREAGAPKDRPVRPEELVATIHRALGLDLRSSATASDGTRLGLSEGFAPIRELSV